MWTRRRPEQPAELPPTTQLDELIHNYIVSVMSAVSERAALDRELRYLSERNNAS